MVLRDVVAITSVSLPLGVYSTLYPGYNMTVAIYSGSEEAWLDRKW
jgi:hypothetical protein